MAWDNQGLVNEKKFHHVEVRRGKIYYKNKLVESRWVRFNRDFEDGYGNWRRGQIAEMQDKEKLVLYLEEGHVTPTDPEPLVTKDPYADAPRANYKFLESVAWINGAYEVGKTYELPRPRGDKYVKRGLCVEQKEIEVRQPGKRS